LLAAGCTAAAMGAILFVATPGGAAAAEKEYTTHFESECVLAPGVLNEKGTIKVSGRATGPESVSPGETFKLANSTITVVTPKNWGENLYGIGVRKARGAVTSTDFVTTGAEPGRLNIAEPPEFEQGLPFVTVVEPKEVEFTVPSGGRTFAIGPYKVTGAPGEAVKIGADTTPGFRPTAAGGYESTHEGIQSETTGYSEENTRVIGPIEVSCTAPPGISEAEIQIVAPSSSTTTTTSSAATETTTSATTETTSSASTTTTSAATTTVSSSSTSTASANAPVVQAVEPGSGRLAGGTPVRVVGLHLSAIEERCVAVNIASCKVSVHFGSKEAAIAAATPTNLLVQSPAAQVPETVDVTVTVNGLTSAITPADRFTYKSELEELEERLREKERSLP
jgi:hypothetical protein